MKILLFCDSDKDDLYSITLLVAQYYFNSVEIVGIICEDGFLSYPQNIQIIQYWTNDILKFHNINIYRGLDRDTYLKQQNNFPESLVSSYINTMTTKFGYNPTIIPTYLKLDQLLIKINRYPDKSISVLTTGNLTTLSHLISTNSNFKNKIKTIYSMIGNYNVDGNVVHSSQKDHKIVANTEYNAYLDPDSFSNIINRYHGILNIIPLDCTNYAPLTHNTILQITGIGTKYSDDTQNIFIKNIFTQFIALLNETFITADTKLYMWSLVATMLFLQKSINQKYITPNINIMWTGKIIDCDDQMINKRILYNYVDYRLLLRAIVDSIFIPADGILGSVYELEYFAPVDILSRHFC